MVMPIYEGTSQIQALMAMKDTLGGDHARAPQAFVKRLAQARWRALSARDPLERRVARLQQLSLSAQQHLITRTADRQGAQRCARAAARRVAEAVLKQLGPASATSRSRCCTPSG